MVKTSEFEISTDRERMDLDLIHFYLSKESYWAQGRSRDVVTRTIQNSHCLGIFEAGRQIGFARVVTDYYNHAYIADVFMVKEHRGRGLGKQLVSYILAHPQLQQVQNWALDTRDAQGLYEQFGFECTEFGRHMALRKRRSE